MEKYYLFLIDMTKGKPKEIPIPMNEEQIIKFINKQDEETLNKNFIYGFRLGKNGIQNVKCFHYAKHSYAFVNDFIDSKVNELLKNHKKNNMFKFIKHQKESSNEKNQKHR